MKELDYLELRKTLESFLMANSIKDSEQCFLLEKEDGRLFFVESVIICSASKDGEKVHALREAIQNLYDKAIQSVQVDSYDFKRYVPRITGD